MNYQRQPFLRPANNDRMPPEMEGLLQKINLEFDYLNPLEGSPSGPWFENRIRILECLVNELEIVIQDHFTGPPNRVKAS